MEIRVKKTWKPTIAGTANIVNGSIKLIASLLLILYIQGIFQPAESGRADVSLIGIWDTSVGVIWSSVVLLTILGVLAIVGGVYALKRKRWEWGLSGSIAALIPCFVMGTLAIIFILQSKGEFE